MKLIDLDDYAALRALIIGESAGESVVGKMAVGCVVRNRVRDPRWPNTIVGVAFQRLQFSCFNHISREDDLAILDMEKFVIEKPDQMYWRESDFVAAGIINDCFADMTKGANHYFATYIAEPSWAKGKVPTVRIGRHLFYRL